MRNIKSSKIQTFIVQLIDCHKTHIEELSSDVYFIILFSLRESRRYPISFVIKGSQKTTTASLNFDVPIAPVYPDITRERYTFHFAAVLCSQRILHF